MNIIFLLKPKSAVAHICATSSIRQGLEKMRYHGYKALPVIDEYGRYVGTVTEGDFLWYIVDGGMQGDLREHEDIVIAELIKKDRARPVRINASMDELLEIAAEQNFAPVVDDRGSFVGIVTRSDIIRHFSKKQDKKASGVHGIA
jgi:CBS-domain-containing membrane protein